jgi:hypothetical protein
VGSFFLPAELVPLRLAKGFELPSVFVVCSIRYVHVIRGSFVAVSAWAINFFPVLENERRELSYSILPPISKVRNRAIRTKAAPNVAREGKVLPAYRENFAWES